VKAAAPVVAPVAETPAAPVEAPVTGDRNVTVTTSAELTAALASAKPGDTITALPGKYSGRFKTTGAGTAEKRIALRGAGAILDGGSVKTGYGLHLDGASFWDVSGFEVTGSEKGVMADSINHSTITGLHVHDVGHEGIHLRNLSSDNTVSGCDVHDTGKTKTQYGEGIYIGNAHSNWKASFSRTAGKPDASDRNVIEGNHIHNTAAESIDVKEGTTGGIIRGNTFEGKNMTGAYADSWVDVKGNGWVIENNIGHGAKLDGYQTHVEYKGFGNGNIFRGNTGEVDAAGYGVNVHTKSTGTVVDASNVFTGAASGLTNLK
jgi:hypothetical protein